MKWAHCQYVPRRLNYDLMLPMKLLLAGWEALFLVLRLPEIVFDSTATCLPIRNRCEPIRRKRHRASCIMEIISSVFVCGRQERCKQNIMPHNMDIL